MKYRKIVALYSIHDFDRILFYTEGYNPHGIKVESIEVTYGSVENMQVNHATLSPDPYFKVIKPDGHILLLPEQSYFSEWGDEYEVK